MSTPAPPLPRDVVDDIALRFAPCGRSVQGYVRGKLRWDPVFRQLAARVPFPTPCVDLGCGQGILLALIARLQTGLTGVGIEWDDRKLAAAADGTRGLEGIDVVRGDVRETCVPRAGTVFLIDVLHYLEPQEQSAVLERAARALVPGGLLIVRDVDTSAGVRAWINRMQERVNRVFGAHWGDTLEFSSAAATVERLRALGLEVSVEPSSGNLPLSNVLITARRPAESDDR